MHAPTDATKSPARERQARSVEWKNGGRLFRRHTAGDGCDDAGRHLELGLAILDAVASFSFLTRFEALSKGVIDVRDVVFFGSLMGVCLVATSAVLEAKKAE